jgi:cytochrome c biogenesis protein CcdA/thiol-disulfide isomerase/thioredoxin
MIILLIFAFLAGFFTVISPCILPVLPIILAAGTTTGKWRPIGIIVGLVLSFTFFTLSLTAIVHTTQISASAFRSVAIVLVFAFGLIMLFPKLSDWFAKISSPLANLGLRIQKNSNSSFFGGFLLGIALGLLWTPCAGPILASITTLAATQSITFATVLITLAYSVGAGIPMLLLAYGGGEIIQSSKFLSQHSQGLRQTFGAIMILTAVAITLHWDMIVQDKVTSIFPTIVIEDNPLVKQELEKMSGKEERVNLSPTSSLEVLPNYGKAAELVGISGWINSPPLTLKQLHGKVVLIDFWTYSCINCLRTLPYIKKWYADYKDKGFVVIGVHTPEFEFEKDHQNVESAAKRLGITYPIAQDNDYKTWQAYQNEYWPAHYLIDQNGNIRSVHFGEGGYVETENAIRNLLDMPPVNKTESEKSLAPISPETYLGLKRGRSYTSEITIKPNVIASYTYKKPLGDDEVGLKGSWKVQEESITAEGDANYLDYNFLAKQVYLVLSGKSKVPVEIYLDGKYVGKFIVDSARKYDIVNLNYGRHNLSLKIPKGINAYAFTFGDE